MKTIVGTVLVYLLTVPQLATSQPDKEWWACQFVHDAGLYWEDNNWKVGSYKMGKPFVLISDGQGSLTIDSVSKATDSSSNNVFCSKSKRAGDIHCQSTYGQSLSFSTANQRGVTTQIFGALMPDGRSRDSLHLRPFECAKG